MVQKQTKPVDEPRDKRPRTERAQKVSQEYADDQREIIKKLRKPTN